MSTQVQLRAHVNVLPRLWAYLSALLHLWVRMSVSPSLRAHINPQRRSGHHPPDPAAARSRLPDHPSHTTTPPFGRLPGAEA